MCLWHNNDLIKSIKNIILLLKTHMKENEKNC